MPTASILGLYTSRPKSSILGPIPSPSVLANNTYCPSSHSFSPITQSTTAPLPTTTIEHNANSSLVTSSPPRSPILPITSGQSLPLILPLHAFYRFPLPHHILLHHMTYLLLHHQFLPCP